MNHSTRRRTLLLENRNTRLRAALLKDLQASGWTSAAYTLRGWAIDTERDGEVERSALLDGVQVQVKRRDDPAWATAFYGGDGGVVLDPERGVAFTIKPRAVKLLRRIPRLGLSEALSR